MKVLITGFNACQSTKDYFFKQHLQIPTAHYGLIRALEDMGHEVEQRIVALGENLDQYDEVILFLHTPSAYSQCLYNAMYVSAVREDVIYSVDDWQVDQIFKDIDKMLKTSFIERRHDPYREFFFENFRGKETPEEVKKYDSHYAEGLKRIVEGRNRFLLPAFSNGDFSKMRLNWPGPILNFDPSPYHYHRCPENGFLLDDLSTLTGVDLPSPEEKKQRWVFASLMQKKTRSWLKKQNVSKWDVDYYGVLKGELKCPRLTEGEMIRTYMNTWGVLAPSYYHAGSGFWRPRARQVVDARSIMVCDPAEGAVYSEAHARTKATEVEQMDLSQLAQLAKDQREGFYDLHPMNKKDSIVELQKILEAPRG